MAALGILVWLGWTGTGTRDELRLAARRVVRMAELRGVIAHLDGWRTMSAQMAALSGGTRWIEGYDEAGSQTAIRPSTVCSPIGSTAAARGRSSP